MNEDRKTDVGIAPRSCTACEQPMRLSYREAVQSGGELRVYECHDCRTTMTVVCPAATSLPPLRA